MVEDEWESEMAADIYELEVKGKIRFLQGLGVGIVIGIVITVLWVAALMHLGLL